MVEYVNLLNTKRALIKLETRNNVELEIISGPTLVRFVNRLVVSQDCITNESTRFVYLRYGSMRKTAFKSGHDCGDPTQISDIGLYMVRVPIPTLYHLHTSSLQLQHDEAPSHQVNDFRFTSSRTRPRSLSSGSFSLFFYNELFALRYYNEN